MTGKTINKPQKAQNGTQEKQEKEEQVKITDEWKTNTRLSTLVFITS